MRAGNFLKPAAWRFSLDASAQAFAQNALGEDFAGSIGKINLLESGMAAANLSFGPTALLSANYSFSLEEGYKNTLLDLSITTSMAVKSVLWQTGVGTAFGKIGDAMDNFGASLRPTGSNRTILLGISRATAGVHAFTSFGVGSLGEKVENGKNWLFNTQEQKKADED